MDLKFKCEATEKYRYLYDAVLNKEVGRLIHDPQAIMDINYVSSIGDMSLLRDYMPVDDDLKSLEELEFLYANGYNSSICMAIGMCSAIANYPERTRLLKWFIDRSPDPTYIEYDSFAVVEKLLEYGSDDVLSYYLSKNPKNVSFANFVLDAFTAKVNSLLELRKFLVNSTSTTDDISLYTNKLDSVIDRYRHCLFLIIPYIK